MPKLCGNPSSTLMALARNSLRVTSVLLAMAHRQALIRLAMTPVTCPHKAMSPLKNRVTQTMLMRYPFSSRRKNSERILETTQLVIVDVLLHPDKESEQALLIPVLPAEPMVDNSRQRTVLSARRMCVMIWPLRHMNRQLVVAFSNPHKEARSQ